MVYKLVCFFLFIISIFSQENDTLVELENLNLNRYVDVTHDSLRLDSSYAEDSLTSVDSLNSDSATVIINSENVAVVDTTYRAWHDSHWRIGLGWSVGALPLFDTWSKGLPKTISDAPIDSVWGDSSYWSVTRIDTPSSYSIMFPIRVSFAPYSNETGALSIDLSAFFISKSNVIKGGNDSLNTILWRSNEHLALSSFSLGVHGMRIIDATYLKVSNIEQVCLIAGLSFTPLTIIKRTTIPVQSEIMNMTAYGIGFGWEFGIGGIRQISGNNGLQINILYTGLFHGRFMRKYNDDYVSLKTYHLNSNYTDMKERLKYSAHRLLICFEILAGSKSKGVQQNDSDIK